MAIDHHAAVPHNSMTRAMSQASLPLQRAGLDPALLQALSAKSFKTAGNVLTVLPLDLMETLDTPQPKIEALLRAVAAAAMPTPVSVRPLQGDLCLHRDRSRRKDALSCSFDSHALSDMDGMQLHAHACANRRAGASDLASARKVVSLQPL